MTVRPTGRRKRDVLRDVAIGACLWPIWLLSVGPGIAMRLAGEYAIGHRQSGARRFPWDPPQTKRSPT